METMDSQMMKSLHTQKNTSIRNKKSVMDERKRQRGKEREGDEEKNDRKPEKIKQTI